MNGCHDVGYDSRHMVIALFFALLVTVGCSDDISGTDPLEGGGVPGWQRNAESVVALTGSWQGVGVIGSGIIVGADGYLLVADHVGSVGIDVTVLTPQGLLPVHTIVRDPVLDLQLVHVPGLQGPVISGLRDSALKPGMPVWAVGAGKGSRMPRKGTVTSIGAEVDRLLPGQALTKTDIRLGPGDSGGALLDDQGKLAGVLVAARAEAGKGEAASVSVGAIRDFLDRIASGELPERGALDIEVRETRNPGLVVVSQSHRRSAGVGELQVGDRITHMNGEPIGDRARFKAVLGAMGPGRPVQIDLLRGNEYLQIDVVTVPLPQPGFANSAGGSSETGESHERVH